MNNNNDCKNRRQAIAASVLDELELQAADELLEHIDACKTCRSLYQALTDEEEVIRSAVGAIADRSKNIQDNLIGRLQKEPREPSRRSTLTLKVILNSRITKLTAAAIIIAAIWGLHLLGGPDFASVTWANVREAFGRVECVHITQYQVAPEGQRIVQGDYWAKQPGRLRIGGENADMSIIVNGSKQLTIDRRLRRVQFSRSKPNQVVALFSWLGFLQGDEAVDWQAFGLTEPNLVYLPSDSNEHVAVYQVAPALGGITAKVWINRATGLLEKQVQTQYVRKADFYDGLDVTVEAELIFKYEPIPDEMFSLAIPEGYDEWYVPVSGTVVGKNGQPVAGAVVYAGHKLALHGYKTAADRNGEWQLKLLPSLTEPSRTVLFPILLWAVKADDPNRVAWTLIEDPNEARQPGGTIPGDVGRIDIFDDDGYHRFAGAAAEVVLEMEAAATIFGTVTDNQGNPLAGVTVSADNYFLADDSGLYIYTNLAVRDGPWVQTDPQGRYLLGGLPQLWHQSNIRIEASKPGYHRWHWQYGIEEPIIESRRVNITLKEDAPSTMPTVTIRGRVINNYGEPLVGYLVGTDLIGQIRARTNEKGEFTMFDCPASPDLQVVVLGNTTPADWNRHEFSKGKEFVFYLNTTEKVGYEQGKDEYYVEVVMEKPEIEFLFEVKNTSAAPIEGLEVRVKHMEMGAQWMGMDKVAATTDANGRCTLRNLPLIAGSDWWLAVQWHFTGEAKTQEEKELRETLKQYNAVITTFQIADGATSYQIEVTVPRVNEPDAGNVEIHPMTRD